MAAGVLDETKQKDERRANGWRRWFVAAFARRDDAPGVRRLAGPALLIALPVIALVGLCYWAVVDRYQDVAAGEREAVARQIAAAQASLGRATTDVCILARANELQNYVRSGAQAPLDLMAREFAIVAMEAGNYAQLRFIDLRGQERARVDATNGALRIVPVDELQNKRARYYVLETLRLDHGALYTSPLDLNIEHGVVEMPHKPMLRLGTPVIDENGDKAGAVVVNVLAETILDAARQASVDQIGTPMMLNRDGYWLLDDVGDRSWGFMFADAIDVRLPVLDEAAWAGVSAAPSGAVRTDQGLYTYAWFTFPEARRRCGVGRPKDGESDHRWLMVSHVSPIALLASQREAALAKAFTVAPLLLLGAVSIRAIRKGVARRREYQAQLEQWARYDRLTGVANRAYFDDRLRAAVREATRDLGRLAIILIDLDRFKDVNDALGHDAGDALLQAVAQRLSGCVRSTDLVARLGGDEFAVLLRGDVARSAVASIGERMLAELQAPLVYAGHEIHPGGSLGIACFPDDGQETAQILKSADVALYRAKGSGRRALCFFEQSMREEVAARLDLAGDMRRSLTAGDFHVVFQPVVRVADGTLRGFEALVRWEHPVRGSVRPDIFLSVAEENGLLRELGEVVLKQVVDELAHLWRIGGHRVVVAFNAAALQLKDPDFGPMVLKALEERKIPPQSLELEITEGVLITDNEHLRCNLDMFRKAGVSLALDDFGTGFASLTHLKQLPVDVLKIDRSFIAGIDRDADSAAIASAIVSLAHSLQMTVVAEGIETAAQHDELRRLGCDYGQGYFLARPAAPETFRCWLTNCTNVPRDAAPADGSIVENVDA